MKEFEIGRIYQVEAARILESFASSQIIHKSGNIAASGDEAEVIFRKFLERRLPSKFYVGHGHIVDKNLNVSPQLDVIIADAQTCPILFEGEKGVQYFPYESVYAFGEIKTRFDNGKAPVERFAKTCEAIKTKLIREKTPSNYIGSGIHLGEGFELDGPLPEYRNPLFTFMIFVDKGDIDNFSLFRNYSSIPDRFLPNIVTFLEGIMLSKAEVTSQNEGLSRGAFTTNSHTICSDEKFYWVKTDFKDSELKSGHALSCFMIGLFEHLNNCVLLSPPLIDYMADLLKSAPSSTELLDARKKLEIWQAQGEEIPPEVFEVLKSKLR